MKGTVEAITGGFGDILAEVGLLIAFGVLTGSVLQGAGAIERLVATLLRVCGPHGMPFATAVTVGTVLQSIFIDVLLVISAPLARRIAPRIGGLGLPRMAVALAIGLECGIVLMVPGVGALAPGRAARGAAGHDAGGRVRAGRADRADRGRDHDVRVPAGLVGSGA